MIFAGQLNRRDAPLASMDQFEKILATDGSRKRKELTVKKSAAAARESIRTRQIMPDLIKAIFIELRLIRLHRRELLIDRLGNVDHKSPGPGANLRIGRKWHVNQMRNAIRRRSAEPIIPFRELRIEPRRLRDQTALIMIGRSGGRAPERGDDDFRLEFAKRGTQSESVVRMIHQHPIGQIQIDPNLHAQNFPCFFRFPLPGLDGSPRSRFAAGQVDNGNPISLQNQLCQSSATENFQIIGVRRDRHNVHGFHIVHSELLVRILREKDTDPLSTSNSVSLLVLYPLTSIVLHPFPEYDMVRRFLPAVLFVAISSLAQAQTPVKAHNALVHCLSLSPDGKLLASAGFDNTIKLWERNGAALKELATLTGHTGPVYAVAFSSDAKLLISSSLDKTARVWSVAEKKMLAEIKGHTDIVDTVAISPDGKQVFTGSADKSVRSWNTADAKALKTLGSHTATVYSVAVSTDGKLLASGGGDNIIRVWDVAGGKELKQLKGHDQAVTGLIFTDATTLASISLDRTIRLWNAPAGTETKKLATTTDDPYGIAWSAKSKKLITCGYSGLLTVWDPATGKSVFSSKVSSPGYCVAVDDDAKTLFSGHDNGTIVVTTVK